jgi:hypothetical protein
LNSTAGSDSIEAVLALLEEDISDTAFQTAMQALDASPALFESLVEVQLVKDALRGSCYPDQHRTAAIMHFIAAAEAERGVEQGLE